MLFWKQEADLLPADKQGSKSEHHFSNALRLYHDSELDRALAELELAISEDDQDNKLFATRGILLCRKGKYHEALQDYSRALTLDPSDAYSYNNRGIAFLQVGRLAEAIDDCNTAISLSNASAAAYCNRGTVLLSLDREHEALADLQVAVEMEPSNSTILTIRGRIWAKLSQLSKAENDFNKAITYSSTNMCALYERGLVLLKRRQYIASSRDFYRIQAANLSVMYSGLAKLQVDKIVAHLKTRNAKRPRVPEAGGRDPSAAKRFKDMGMDMLCPITQEVFADPVVADDGHSYERSAIELWLALNNTSSPMTNQPLRSLRLVPNHTLRKCIQHTLGHR